MEKRILPCLSLVSKYLNVHTGKISLNDFGICTRKVNNDSVTGVFNIIHQLIIESGIKINLEGKTCLDAAFVRQWIEYCILYGSQSNENVNHNILTDLNLKLLTKTYIVGNNLTIADVMLYYVVFNTVNSLSCLEKEKFINVCRWFDNLQQDEFLRQSNKLVDFVTNNIWTLSH